MSKKDTDTLTEQQKRRLRVNRMKNLIIITIAGWMLISCVAIVVLSVQVARLNTKIKKLNQDETNNRETVIAGSESTEETLTLYPNLVTGIDTDDNVYSDGEERKVYLTFDCIPSENTNAILDVLKEYNVKATFFVTGDSSEEAQVIYQRIVDEGHTLAMHSYSNDYSQIYSSSDAFLEDTKELQDYLTEVTGVTPTVYRFPGGSMNELTDINMAEFAHILNDEGITYFDWNVTAGDAGVDYTAQDIVDNVTAGVSNYINSVVLLHDTESNTVTADSLGSLITALEGMNAELLPIDDTTYVVQYIKAYSVE